MGPPCGHVCAVCAVSGGDANDMSTAGDENTVDTTEKGAWSDDEDDLMDILFMSGKGVGVSRKSPAQRRQSSEAPCRMWETPLSHAFNVVVSTG